MCHQIACATCGKPTWEGCGEHIEEALKSVALNERCSCPRPEASEAEGPQGLLGRILGR